MRYILTCPLHADKRKEVTLFYELFPSYAFIVPINKTLSKQEFINAVTGIYDCNSEPRNRAFVEAAKLCAFLSVSRTYDSYSINF